MNIQEARARVEEIERIRGDDEAAHLKEDQLYEDFIRHVAVGKFGDLTEVAREILKTGEIEFSRWYA